MAGLKIFVSYTSADRDWAHWIAWTLKEAGYEPFVHEWEVGAGESIPAWMERRLGEADRLIGVFSEKYTEALFSKSERTAAYWDDPMGKRGFLTPVAIEAIPKWPPFVAPLKRLSLVDLDPDAARFRLGAWEPRRLLRRPRRLQEADQRRPRGVRVEIDEAQSLQGSNEWGPFRDRLDRDRREKAALSHGVVPIGGRAFALREQRLRVLLGEDADQAVGLAKTTFHPRRDALARADLPLMHERLVPRFLERPGDPVRPVPVGAGVADEDLEPGHPATKRFGRCEVNGRIAALDSVTLRSVGIELDVKVVVRRLGEGFEQHVVVLADDLRDFRRERLALGDRDVVGAEVERPVLEVQ